MHSELPTAHRDRASRSGLAAAPLAPGDPSASFPGRGTPGRAPADPRLPASNSSAGIAAPRSSGVEGLNPAADASPAALGAPLHGDSGQAQDRTSDGLLADWHQAAEQAACWGGVFAPEKRLVVAMSGGVDSSLVAWLLARAQHPLVGLFMRNGVKPPADEAQAAKKSCCSVNDARDARMVAAGLGIPFQAVDLKSEFAEVIRYFIAEYGKGRTPNPCAICNRDLKFDRLLTLAEELGAEGVATGHYARLDRQAGRVRVRRGVDTKKDQSYQLFAVSEAHLARTRLPLGDFTKDQVRHLAARAGLRTAAKKDSQEICFVPGNDYRRLLEEAGVELHPGQIVDSSGRVLKAHDGVENFTIGQRRGHGIGGTAEPLYVVDLEVESGTVVLGSKDECASPWLTTGAVNWIGIDPPAGGELRAEVQIRYQHRAAPALIEWDPSGARVQFDEPQLAVATGQGAAFYLGERLIGGGWIERASRPQAGGARTGR